MYTRVGVYSVHFAKRNKHFGFVHTTSFFYSIFDCFAVTHSRAVCCLFATSQEVLRRQTLKTFMKYRCNNVKNYQQWADIVHEVSEPVLPLFFFFFLHPIAAAVVVLGPVD